MFTLHVRPFRRFRPCRRPSSKCSKCQVCGTIQVGTFRSCIHSHDDEILGHNPWNFGHFKTALFGFIFWPKQARIIDGSQPPGKPRIMVLVPVMPGSQTLEILNMAKFGSLFLAAVFKIRRDVHLRRFRPIKLVNPASSINRKRHANFFLFNL